jgi:hypothetical protein
MKRARTSYVERVFLHLCDLEVTLWVLVRPGRETSMHYFSCLGELMLVSQEACRDTLRRTYVFASCAIWRSHNAFQGIRGVKCRRTIFHIRVGPGCVPQEVP